MTRPLALACRAPVTAAADLPPEPEEAGRLFAELHVLGRRLERVHGAVAGLPARESGPRTGWARCAAHVAEARRAVEAALRAVPDLPLAEPRAPAVLDVGALRVAPGARRADFAGRPLTLARKEFDLLVLLAEEPAVVVPKARLLREVGATPRRA